MTSASHGFSVISRASCVIFLSHKSVILIWWNCELIFVADKKYLSIGDVSLPLKNPLKPELVPVNYSKLLRFIYGQFDNDD